ncbi:hypothetical protein FKM82_013265 [Ascaphus truei]
MNGKTQGWPDYSFVMRGGLGTTSGLGTAVSRSPRYSIIFSYFRQLKILEAFQCHVNLQRITKKSVTDLCSTDSVKIGLQ